MTKVDACWVDEYVSVCMGKSDVHMNAVLKERERELETHT